MFVVPSAYPLGGLATWIDYLVPGLEKSGWKPLLGLTAGNFHDADAYMNLHPIGNMIKIVNRTGTREGRIRNLCKAIVKYLPKIVVGVNIPDTYTAIERLRQNGKFFPKSVMTIHGIQPDLYEDASVFCKVFDGVICTNILACKLIQEETNIDPALVYYAPYGVELPLENNKHIKKSSGPLRIAYAGRLDHYQKRVHDIPKIFNILNHNKFNYELIIAGGGPEEEFLKKRLYSTVPCDKFKFLGVLSQSDLVNQVYRKADVLLVTSSWETGPIVILEAMSRGVAVVTSSYLGSGLENCLINNDNCLMFEIGNVNRAAECIKLIHDPKFRESIIKGGYRLIRKRYSHEKSIQSWNLAFRQILSVPPRNSRINITSIKPAGRLDKIFGVSWGENFRRILGLSYKHKGPGGEWPHSYGKRAQNDKLFWDLAKKLDSQNFSNI